MKPQDALTLDQLVDALVDHKDTSQQQHVYVLDGCKVYSVRYRGPVINTLDYVRSIGRGSIAIDDREPTVTVSDNPREPAYVKHTRIVCRNTLD